MRQLRGVSGDASRLTSRRILTVLRFNATFETNVAPVSHDKHRISISDPGIFPNSLRVRWKRTVGGCSVFTLSQKKVFKKNRQSRKTASKCSACVLQRSVGNGNSVPVEFFPGQKRTARLENPPSVVWYFAYLWTYSRKTYFLPN